MRFKRSYAQGFGVWGLEPRVFLFLMDGFKLLHLRNAGIAAYTERHKSAESLNYPESFLHWALH